MSRRQATTMFVPRADAESRRARAIRAMRALLAADLRPDHLRELLSVCLWKLTESESGKYRTRFRSVAALDSPRETLAHDHVYERAKLVAELIAWPERIEEIAARAVGCIVTRDEHARLTALSRARPELLGWARYAAAGLEVVDVTHRTSPKQEPWEEHDAVDGRQHPRRR